MKLKQFLIAIIGLMLSLSVQARYYVKKIIHDDGNCTGEIEVVAEGMSTPFTYKWSNNQEGKKLENLCAGIYEVEILNKYKCTTMLQVEILQQEQAKSFSSFAKTDACSGIANGAATISLDDTKKELHLKWDNGNTNTFRKNLPEGEHCYSLFKTTEQGDVMLERQCIVITTDSSCSASDQLIYQFKAHPNPFTDNLTINIARASEKSANGILFIYNTDGKEMMRKKLNLEAGHNKLNLKIDTELPNGLYSLRYHEKGMKQAKTTQIVKVK